MLASDKDNLHILLDDRAVYATTFDIRFPFKLHRAALWIERCSEQYHLGRRAQFGIVRKSDDCLIGEVGLLFEIEHDKGELAYVIGRKYWNNGIATEAAWTLVDWGFNTLRLHKIIAGYFAINPASGKVLSKLGFVQEGYFRQGVKKDDQYIDNYMMGLLAEEWRLTRPVITDERNEISPSNEA